MAYSYNEIVLCNKMEWTTSHNMDTSQKQLADQKKPETKQHILYNSMYLKFWKKYLIYCDRKSITVSLGPVWNWLGWDIREFWEVMKMYCISVLQVDTWVYEFVKTDWNVN